MLYYHRGTRLNATKRFSLCSLFMIPLLNFLTFPPPDSGMLRRSRCVQIFLLKTLIIGCKEKTALFAAYDFTYTWACSVRILLVADSVLIKVVENNIQNKADGMISPNVKKRKEKKCEQLYLYVFCHRQSMPYIAHGCVVCNITLHNITLQQTEVVLWAAVLSQSGNPRPQREVVSNQANLGKDCLMNKKGPLTTESLGKTG